MEDLVSRILLYLFLALFMCSIFILMHAYLNPCGCRNQHYIVSYVFMFLKWFVCSLGIIASLVAIVRPPLPEISGNRFHSYLYEKFCSKNSSNNSLPAEWFEKVNNVMRDSNFREIEHTCVALLIYAVLCALVECSFFKKVDRQLSEIWKITDKITSPDDIMEHKKSIVKLMISKVSTNEKYFLYFLTLEFLLFCLSLLGLLFNSINLMLKPGFAASKNASEWSVNCDPQPIARDMYTLAQGQHNTTDYFYPPSKYDSICIIPTRPWRLGTTAFFVISAILYFMKLLINLRQLWYFGLHKMNDMLLVRLIMFRIDDEILDPFERALEERRRQEVTRLMQQPPSGYNMEMETQSVLQDMETVPCRRFRSRFDSTFVYIFRTEESYR